MFTRHEPASGLFRYRNGPLFCCLLFLCTATLAGQTDSLHVFRVDAGTEYFDIFSQTSDRADSKIFTAAHFAGATFRSGSDSFSLFFRSTKKYGALQQRNSLLSFSSTNHDRTIETLFNSRWHFVAYSVMLGYNIDEPAGRLLYGGELAVSPWGQPLTVSASFIKRNRHLGNGIFFRDYIAAFDDAMHVSLFTAGFTVMPADAVNGEFFYERTTSSNESPRTGTGAEFMHRNDMISARLRHRPDNDVQWELFAERSASTGDIILTQDAQSFGNIDAVQTKQTEVGLEHRRRLFSLPVIFRYTYHEIFMSGSGTIESWPFTTLAASVIANRILFNAGGSVKYHSAALSTGFSTLHSAVTFELEYDKVITDMALEHWEPEFLVFGMKNFTRDPFSVSTAHLGKLHIHFSQSISTVTVGLYIAQYFPLKIDYRKFEPVQIGPPAPISTSRKTITDGGRKIGFRFSVDL